MKSLIALLTVFALALTALGFAAWGGAALTSSLNVFALSCVVGVLALGVLGLSACAIVGAGALGFALGERRAPTLPPVEPPALIAPPRRRLSRMVPAEFLKVYGMVDHE